MSEWKEIIAISLSLAALLAGLYKWSIVRRDKTRQERNDAQDRTLKEHAGRLERHSERLEKLDDLINAVRSEMHQNYPKLDRIERIEESIKRELEKLHHRVGGISRELSEQVGIMRANHDNEVSSLIKSIQAAIEHKP